MKVHTLLVMTAETYPDKILVHSKAISGYKPPAKLEYKARKDIPLFILNEEVKQWDLLPQKNKTPILTIDL